MYLRYYRFYFFKKHFNSTVDNVLHILYLIKLWILKPQKDHLEVLTMYTLNFSWAQFDEAQLDVEVVKEMNHEVLRQPHHTVYEAKRPEEQKTVGNGLPEKYPEVIFIWGRILKLLLGWVSWVSLGFFFANMFLSLCLLQSILSLFTRNINL